MTCAESLDLFRHPEHIPPGYRSVGQASCLSLKDGQDARPHRVIPREVDRPKAATGF